MGFTWLWLEDERETVADLREEVAGGVRIEDFETITAVTRWLLRNRQAIQSGQQRIGFILDVMIHGAHAVTRPKGWCNGSQERTFLTQSGYEAGLVFYESLILSADSSPIPPWLLLPPPVIFLTVAHTDREDFEARLAALQERWLKQHPQKPSEARVRWIRKWDVAGNELLTLLRQWQEPL